VIRAVFEMYDLTEEIDKVCSVGNCKDRFLSTQYYLAHLIDEHQRVYSAALTGETFRPDMP